MTWLYIVWRYISAKIQVFYLRSKFVYFVHILNTTFNFSQLNIQLFTQLNFLRNWTFNFLHNSTFNFLRNSTFNFLQNIQLFLNIQPQSNLNDVTAAHMW
jgi:hypothetical protein